MLSSLMNEDVHPITGPIHEFAVTMCLGTPGLILALLSLVPLIIWDILIARKLFQLGNAALKAHNIQQ